MFPFVLQFEQFLGGFLPVVAFGDGFGLEAEVNLLVVVLGLFVLDSLEVLFLVGVEAVDVALEGVPDFLVLFARDGSDGLPYLEELVEGCGCVVPAFCRCGHFGCQLHGFLDQGLFCQEVLVHFFAALLVVFAAAFVDLVGGVAEASPDVVVLFDGHGTNLAPLFAEQLQFPGGLGDGRFHDEFFGFLADEGLALEVFLLVEEHEFLVHLDLAEELFDEEVVVLPKAVDFGARHVADGFPAFLDGVEVVVGLFQALVVVVDELAEFVKDFLFLFQVFLFDGLELVDMFLSALAVLVICFAVGFGDGVVAALIFVLVAAFGDEAVEGLFLGLLVGVEEGNLDGAYAVFNLGDVVVLEEFLEGGHHFLARHGGAVDDRFFLDEFFLLFLFRVGLGGSLGGLLRLRFICLFWLRGGCYGFGGFSRGLCQCFSRGLHCGLGGGFGYGFSCIFRNVYLNVNRLLSCFHRLVLHLFWFFHDRVVFVLQLLVLK